MDAERFNYRPDPLGRDPLGRDSLGRWFLTGKNLASSKILVYTFPLYTRKVRGEGIPWIRLC